MIVKNSLLIIILIASFALCKESVANKANYKVGVGLEFDFEAVFLTSNKTASLYIPIHTKGAFVEPEFIYFKETFDQTSTEYSYQNGSSEESGVGLAVGFYNLVKYDSINMYSGLKLGYASYVETSDSPYYGEQDEEGTAFIVAPVIGSEYLISDNFTFGGEVSLQYTYSKSVDNLNSYEESERTEIFFRPKFMIRYYY